MSSATITITEEKPGELNVHTVADKPSAIVRDAVAAAILGIVHGADDKATEIADLRE